MAAASVLTPSSHYQPPSFAASTYPPQSSSANSPTPAMISSSEPPRRAPDDNSSPPEAPARQSLPSISEVISGTGRGPYPPPPAHGSLPPQPGSGGLPSPFAPPSRQYNDSDKHSRSPQPLHPASFPPRQDAIPAFADSPRPPFSGRPGLPPVTDRRPTPPGKPDGPSHHDHRSISGGYPQPPAPTSHPYQPGPMPHGQMPLPGYPISPRHEHYDAPRPQTHGEPAPYARSRYEAAPRHYENWSYHESFSRIASSSRTLFTFAEVYIRAAQEQQAAHGSFDRLPNEREVNEMLANVDYIKRSLEQVRDIVQHTERAREGAKNKSHYDEGHDPMYSDGMKPHYPVNEVKKRRGRAAPPGRCHSCNRIDTPEWRRGPDGARTLCNACGLHYAKLERKRQLEARAMRPKTEERN
ncbi:sexual development transcription factor NsdD [Cordyceps fumosorosea ARSEF 2679]|uniref:Sexual development transcription factor NsdD n=1 Tax=Cordyceps fumosorosea (strain ARSEF 2679) TaxID=1081104 RepID=A0A167QKG9_CORFA|nr:sexual development transcription factor NsdD [Cordyceps fumosorosea ARSEF 2679]OAA57723.1 sexual development transcription factor NsdD [Cordyceps fumosorosea ARSEF 2679]